MYKYKNKSGYILIRVNEHPRAYNGFVLEHIVVMEKYLNSFLPKGAVVHHRNKIKNDNRIENLLLMRSQQDHFALHRAMDAGDKLIVQAFELWSYEFMYDVKYNNKKSPENNTSVNIKKTFVDKIVDKDSLTLKEELFQELRSERLRLSKEFEVPAYIICHDSTLLEMVEKLPANEFELRRIFGIGPFKLERYGNQFIKIIRRYINYFDIAS